MQSLYLNRLTGISMPNFAGFFSGLWNLQARVESMFTLDKSNPFSFIDNIGKGGSFTGKMYAESIFAPSVNNSPVAKYKRTANNIFEFNKNPNKKTTGTYDYEFLPSAKGRSKNLINFASSFVGKINSDSRGNAMFSKGVNQPWCADFVTYCVRKSLGRKIPSDFGSSAVSDLRDWGYNHNCYFKAPSTSNASKMKNFLRTKVRPGDIMIQKRNKRSHTGIVKSVAPDGSSYTVVEGNSSDRVKTVTYKATSSYLDGFVSLAKYA